MNTQIDTELMSPDFREDPYPTYRKLRELGAPYWSDAWEAWIVTTFDHVTAAFRDWEHLSNEGRLSTVLDHLSPEELQELLPLQRYASTKGLVHSDPPQHTQLRQLIQPTFFRAAIDKLRPRVQVIVDDLLDRVDRNGTMDIVADYARPLPVAVICEMLGVPMDDQHKFRRWSDLIHPLQGNRRPSLEIAQQAQAGYMGLYDYMAALIEDRRRALTVGHDADDDLISHLVRNQPNTDVNDADLITTCVTLLSAGFQATSSAVANTVLLLLSHPGQLDLLRSNPELASAAVEESLRFESPGHSVPRRVARETAIGPCRLREGDLALLMVAAANRDPLRFADPDTFNISRSDRRHLAFGSGIHLCVGAPLARLEAPLAVGTLFSRFTEMHLLDERIELNDLKPNGRSPDALNVRFVASTTV